MLCSVSNGHLTFSNERVVHLVSDLNAEGPPVPIPNTEVKLCSGENTCLETSREDSSLLTLISTDVEMATFLWKVVGDLYFSLR